MTVTVYNQYMTTGTSNTNTVTVIKVYNQYMTTGTSNTNTVTVITVHNQYTTTCFVLLVTVVMY
jgi:hypothetical protein